MPVRKKKASAKKTKNSARSVRYNSTPVIPALSTEKTGSNFVVVGIGASAGGLEAFIQLLKHLPHDLGMAFIFIQHLDPTHESKLTDVLSRVTKMPVSEIKNGESVVRNHLYIIPPNADVELTPGMFRIMPRKFGRTKGVHMPVDSFFRSLADVQKTKAIGIILSGTGSDGTLGMQEIKEHGGITFAQEETSAKYDGMPRSAIMSGYVDFVLPVEEIAKELLRIAKHPYIASHKELTKEEQNLRAIFQLLRKQKQVDFSHYKRNTIERRILRRMAVNRVSTLADYLTLLQDKPGEVQALFQDMLIKVTGFFRDPATFETLKTKIFPKLIKDRKADAPIRIWVPGCSTGEEAYSLAICLLEFLDKKHTFPVQIFATDVSEWAVERARAGQYVENIALDVSVARLQKFFTKITGGYQVNKVVRDVCIFARHDITNDPPFSHIDLISCRNLLIYLETLAQRRVIQVFHYALNPHGFFVLGSAESLARYPDFFGLINKKYNVYQKRHHSQPVQFQFRLREHGLQTFVPEGKPAERNLSSHDINMEADRVILSRFAPCGVVINEDMQILQFRGQTGDYLEAPPGEASLSLMRMAKGNLAMMLRPLIHKAIKENDLVERLAVDFRLDGVKKTLNLRVTPLEIFQNRREARFWLVLFEDVTEFLKKTGKERVSSEYEVSHAYSREIIELQRELQATRDYLQAIIETQEATNEELKSANEEIQSSNEELQSTNEELETNKEELQSTNEELTTLNEELQNRNIELDHVNNDRTNLLHSINIPILMLTNDLKIRWFTPVTQRVFNIIASDVGRAVTDMKMNFEFPDLMRLIHESMETLQVKEREVQHRDGRWYLLRIRPYRTSDNRIEGAVLMFVDIDAMKKAMGELQYSRSFSESIVETVRHPLLIMTKDLQIVRVNEAFLVSFPADGGMPAQNFFELSNGMWNIPELRRRLEALVNKNKPFESFLVKIHTEKGERQMIVDARPIYQQQQQQQLYLLAMEDITERKQAEQLAYQQTMLKEIHHRIKNNLQIISSLLHLQSNFIEDKQLLEMFRESQNRVRSMALVHEKLYQSHDITSIDFAEYVKDLAHNLQRSYGVKPETVKVEIGFKGVEMNIDTAVPSALIVSELLSNALKYAFPDGRKGTIRIGLSSASDNGRKEFVLTVRDNGVGLPEDLDVGQTESLGLLLVRKLVEQLDGKWEVARDHGTTFRLRLTEVRSRGTEPTASN